uniref:Uncharacterized LOC102446540 n=1 Tax=Pelodiscus sinensis TaxID=13735 RepID=K7FCQ9_PELSI|nr:uncharacterized protein LOC102446540 [Pelodiscus sinensis]|eukprot:XP_006110231.1 uncharacterized protein LOC102446540 [Pelodiscus sinensis]
METLRDALKKKDRVLMEVPQYLVFGESGEPRFWMERHAILTEKLVRGLISELGAVTFKEDLRKEIGGKSREHTYAYVYPTAGDRTVYLCPLFWKAPAHLGEDSQPGTLIHEVSHFLGVRDLTYSKAGITVACRGKLVKSASDPDSLGKALRNANNIEYEFEITLNHKGGYENGRYLCCGETAENSVCERAVPDEFLDCSLEASLSGKKEINQTLMELLSVARDRLQEHLAKLRKLAEDIDNVHRGATIANITGGAVGIAGGITTIAGLCLTPFTFGASLGLSLAGLAAATAGGLTSAAATTTDMITSASKKETVAKLLENCQTEVGNISKCAEIFQKHVQRLESCGDNAFIAVAQIGAGAGRVVLNATKMVKAGQLLANAGRVARFAGTATRILTGVTLGLDIFFVAKDSVELHQGAETELARNIREAVNEMEKMIDQVNELYKLPIAK